MKKLPFIAFLLFSILLKGQVSTLNAFLAEESTYFTAPFITNYGIVASDNYHSKIYILTPDSTRELLASAGCGLYYTLSADRAKICYKSIDAKGEQAPAIFDIETRTITLLHKPVALCGQPAFGPDNEMAFTAGDTLYKIKNKDVTTISLGEYSNCIAFSPSGKYISLISSNGGIKIIDTQTFHIETLTSCDDDYYLIRWSPAADILLFSSVENNIFIYDAQNGVSNYVANGNQPAWSPAGTRVVFYRITSTGNQISGTELLLFDPALRTLKKISHNDFPFVFDPVFTADNKLLFHTFTDKTFLSASIDNEGDSLKDYIQLYSHPQPLPVKFYNTHLFLKNKTSILVPGTVPYVHQVYDTPSWHYGYGSCAPSSAIMSVAYFNLLPPWPFTSNSPVVHTSEYGNYVCDKYRFREYYYNTAALTGGSNPADAWGGYGYMWNGSYSPNSTMMNYVEQHDLISNQYWTTACKFDSTVWEINHAFPHSICSYLTTSGHLTLAIGYVSGQHTLIFHDPYGNKNNGYMNFYGQNVYYDWPGYNNGLQNLNGAAWNIKSEGYQKTYNDTLIDDEYYNHGFYIHNQPPSHMRYYRDKKTGGYLNHFWYTYTTAASFDTCYVTWTPSLPYTAIYEILAYIPAHTINATVAKYRVYHANGDTLVVISQQANVGQWVSLGHYVCASGNSSYVKLGDGTGVQGQTLGFDAVQWKKTGTISSSNEAEINEDVRVYPNPAAEVINIYAGNPAPARIFATLKNIAGSIVFSGLLPESSDIFTLKTDRLPTGCYLLSIEFDGKKLNKKIIIH